MKRIAIVLALGAIVGASFVRLPEAGDAVNPHLVDGELQAVFAPPRTNPGGGFATGDGIDAGTATGLSLADALTLERRASLWWEYARDIASVTSRLTHKGETTLLVPVDRAIMALPRKPSQIALTSSHQNADGSVASEKEARANVESFLSAHIVPGTVKPDKPAQTLHENVEVTVTGEDGAWIVQPGDIKVLGVTQASNGKIYYLDGVVSF